MKPWLIVLLVWAACGLALAQAAGDDESVKVLTQSSGREVSGTNASEGIKLNLNVKLVRLPGAEAASLWRASSLGDRPAEAPTDAALLLVVSSVIVSDRD